MEEPKSKAKRGAKTAAAAQEDKITLLPLSELHDFPNHPFKVRNDEAMQETAESIRQYGVLVPAIVRPREDGGYEIIAGHRRRHSSELAGLSAMPCIVRQMDDDTATILMVDSNIQRENILPSERAQAYKMKLDAICYNTPFPEMQGNIVPVDYERSSWRYMSYERSFRREDLEAFKTGGATSGNYDTIAPYLIGKGGGSAYGGKWRPSPKKPEDQRFLGKPGEIKTTYKNGYRVETKIGEDGRAMVERHYTDHKQPWAHTNPHDHTIRWDNPAGFPDPQPALNYPDGAPEFKQFRGMYYMKNTIVPANTYEQNRFITISDFKTCMRWHGEVEFTWNGSTYSITHRKGKIAISLSYRQETEKLCDTADEVLDYMVGSDRLRDVITQVTVIDRTI